MSRCFLLRVLCLAAVLAVYAAYARGYHAGHAAASAALADRVQFAEAMRAQARRGLAAATTLDAQLPPAGLAARRQRVFARQLLRGEVPHVHP